MSFEIFQKKFKILFPTNKDHYKILVLKSLSDDKCLASASIFIDDKNYDEKIGFFEDVICLKSIKGQQTANIILDAMIALCWHNGCDKIIVSGDNTKNDFNYGYYNFAIEDESLLSETDFEPEK